MGRGGPSQSVSDPSFPEWVLSSGNVDGVHSCSRAAEEVRPRFPGGGVSSDSAKL